MKKQAAKKASKKATESKKTLHNTTASKAKNNVKDIIFWGDGDTFKLISKASSKNEGWMKSTKAMQIDEVGCVVQATTQQGNNVAEALTFVPNVMIEENKNDKGEVISRKLVPINNIYSYYDEFIANLKKNPFNGKTVKREYKAESKKKK